jgi:hypothetical protein
MQKGGSFKVKRGETQGAKVFALNNEEKICTESGHK